MTSVSKTTYASGAEVEVVKKTLNSGEFVQLRISYDPQDSEKHRGTTDVFIVTLSTSQAYDLANAMLTKGAPG
jgi:hypothetical protein